jgi:hypothetical protein
MLQVLVIISQKFGCREEACAMQKLFRTRKKVEKDKCLRYLKQWVLRYPSEKRKKRKEMNKIAHVLLQKDLQTQKREICFQGA